MNPLKTKAGSKYKDIDDLNKELKSCLNEINKNVSK